MSRLMTPVDPKHNIIQRKLDVIERSKTPNIKSNNNDNPTINYNLISVPDPTLFSRSDLLSWASNYPQVNKKKKSTSTAKLCELYLQIEKQNLANLRQQKLDNDYAYENRILIATKRRQQQDIKITQRLLGNVPFLQQHGNLFKLDPHFDRDKPRIVITIMNNTAESKTSLKPLKNFNVVTRNRLQRCSSENTIKSTNTVKGTRRGFNSSSSTNRLHLLPLRKRKQHDMIQARRIALALKSELRPLNIQYTQRQNERSTRWLKAIYLVNIITLFKFKLIRSKSQIIVAKFWKSYITKERWKKITTPKVVHGMLCLRKIVRRFYNIKNIHIIKKFLKEASKKNVAIIAIQKLRYNVIKIQRTWCTYRLITKHRLIAIQKKWLLIEKRNKLFLLDKIKRNVNMKKLASEKRDNINSFNKNNQKKNVGYSKKIKEQIDQINNNSSNTEGHFNRFLKNIKSSLKGNGKTSPACVSKKDLSGLTLRVARLLNRMETTCCNSLIQTNNVNLIERLKKQQQNKLKLITKRNTIVLEEPMEYLVAVDMRRRCCMQILNNARLNWLNKNKNKNQTSIRNKRVQQSNLQFNVLDMKKLLLNFSTISQLVERKKKNGEDFIVKIIDDGHRLFTSHEMKDEILRNQIVKLLAIEKYRSEKCSSGISCGTNTFLGK